MTQQDKNSSNIGKLNIKNQKCCLHRSKEKCVCAGCGVGELPYAVDSALVIN